MFTLQLRQMTYLLTSNTTSSRNETSKVGVTDSIRHTYSRMSEWIGLIGLRILVKVRQRYARQNITFLLVDWHSTFIQ